MTIGKVISRVFWKPLAPSISAASYISFGMVDRMPIIISMETGKLSQKLARISVIFAQRGSDSQGALAIPSIPKY